MANTIIMKHSTVADDEPANGDFVSGEIILNTADRLMWFGNASGDKSTLNISSFNNDSGYTTNTGTTTASNAQTFTNKQGNITQWNSGTLSIARGGTGASSAPMIGLITAANAGAARTAIGCDAAGTDNSTNVTLATVSGNYLSLSGQAITAGTVPLTLGGTGATTAGAARTALGVDAAGTDNSTNVTLANTNYLSISGQAITGGTVPVGSGGTNLTSFTSGDILYATGSTTLAKLAKGTANQILAMDSSAGAPEWITGGGDITSVALTGGTGIDINNETGTTSGDYSSTIAVDVSDFLATGVNNYVVTAISADGLKGEANLTFDGTDLTIDGSGKVIFNDANSYIMQSSESFYIRGHNDMYFNIDTPNDSTARHFIWRANTSTELMRLGEDKLLEMEGNLHLKADASAIKLGAGEDFTITHDNDIGGTIAGSPVTITSAEACKWSTSSGALEIESASDIDLDAAGDIELNADGDEIDFKFGGASGHLKFSNTNSGDIVIRQMINNKDIVFKDNGDSEVMRIDDDDGIQLGGSGAVVSTIQSTNESFADNDTSLMTSAAILDKIGAELPTKFDSIYFTTDSGTGASRASDTSGTSAEFVMTGGSGMNVTNSGVNISIAAEDSTASNKGAVIVAGTSPISVGYSSGTATVAVSDVFLRNDGADTTSGVITAGGFTTTGTWTFDTTGSSTQGITELTKSGETFNDSDAALMTAAAINDRIGSISGGGEDNQNAFSNVAASGQTTVTADSSTDTLTLVASGGMTITTSGNDVTLSSANTTYGSYSGSSPGLAPIRSAGNTTSKYLREDGGWEIPPDTNTNTQYSAGTGLTLSTTTFSVDAAQTQITTIGALAQHLLPGADDTYDLGSASAAWQDLYLEGNLSFTDDSNISNVSTISGHSGSNITLDSANGIILDSDSASSGVIYKDGGTELLRIYNSSSDVIIESKVQDKDIIFKGDDGGSAITALTLDMGSSGAAYFNDTVFVGDDLRMNTDGSTIKMGVNEEILIEHIHNTGVRLTDSGGSPTLQLHDDGESVSSDGSKLILTSNGVAYSMPTADASSSGDALTSNGSGTLSWTTISGGGGSGDAWSDQVDSDLVPDTNNAYDLGTVSRQFKDAFFDGTVEADGYSGAGNSGIDVGVGQFSFATAGMPAMQVDLTASVGIVTGASSAPGASDSRVKENITDFTTGLSLIDALKLKTFTYKDGYGASGTHIGVLTQDIETIDSEYVNVAKEGDETYGDIAGISMKFGNEYRMALIKSVQELSAKNDALEARIAALEG